jgi:hypothetical protein
LLSYLLLVPFGGNITRESLSAALLLLSFFSLFASVKGQLDGPLAMAPI